MAAKSAPNPFASAREQTPAAATAKGTTFPARAIIDLNGVEIFSQTQVREALTTYVTAARTIDAADTQQKTVRPIIESLGEYVFTGEWAKTRSLPDNPQLTAEPNGGASVRFVIQDRQINCSNTERERIAQLVGAERVDECVVNKDVFTLAPDVLEQTVELTVTDPKGKKAKVTKTVMDHMADALQEKFKETPDLLAALFTVKKVQQTAKGLITRGLELSIPRNANLNIPGQSARLMEFLQTIKAPIQIKPVGV